MFAFRGRGARECYEQGDRRGENGPAHAAAAQDPIGATLLRLAWPNIVLTMVQASVGLIETYFVAKLGTDALAGMALVFPVVMLIQMMSAGAMGGGISSAIARTLGSGRREAADALVWHAVAIAVGLGLLTTLAALPRRARALRRDGRQRRLADCCAGLFGHAVRRRRADLAVQLARQRDPRHRQHVPARRGGLRRVRRC